MDPSCAAPSSSILQEYMLQQCNYLLRFMLEYMLPNITQTPSKCQRTSFEGDPKKLLLKVLEMLKYTKTDRIIKETLVFQTLELRKVDNPSNAVPNHYSPIDKLLVKLVLKPTEMLYQEFCSMLEHVGMIYSNIGVQQLIFQVGCFYHFQIKVLCNKNVTFKTITTTTMIELKNKSIFGCSTLIVRSSTHWNFQNKSENSIQLVYRYIIGISR